MSKRVTIVQASSDPRVLGRGALALARCLGLGVDAARRLIEGRTAIPAGLEDETAQQLALALTAAGLPAQALAGPPRGSASCASHPALDSEAHCQRCRAPICAVCVLSHRAPRCVSCEQRHRRGAFTRNLRVAALLLLLVAIGGWGLLRHRRLDSRTQWLRAVSASVVLVSQHPASPAGVARWRAGMGSLEAWFGREWRRYRPASAIPMVTLSLDAVVGVDTLPIAPGAARDLVGRAEEWWSFDAALESIDAQVAAHASRDATIYVVLRPTATGGGVVEGVAEAGGRLGMVEGSLDDEDLGLELTAVAHELLHCLGATDKYDADGHAVAPQGLADPTAQPLFPQRAAEVMVGEIPVASGAGRPFERLDEVQVGPATARELRW